MDDIIEKIISENSVFFILIFDDKNNIIEKNYIVVKKDIADKHIADSVKQIMFKNGKKLLENTYVSLDQSIYDVDKFIPKDILITLVGKLQKFSGNTFKIQLNGQEIEDVEGKLYIKAGKKAKDTNLAAESILDEKIREHRSANKVKSQEQINVEYLQSLLKNQGNG